MKDEPLGRAELAIAAAVMLLVACTLFGPVVGFPFLSLDDVGQIQQNPLIAGADASLVERLFTPSAGYIVPVTVEVERIVFALGGGEAAAFHAFAVLMHALCGLLAFALARALGAARVVAPICVLAASVHPLCVQPVAWAICIKDLLMTAFVLGACLAAVHAWDERTSPARAARAAFAMLVLAALAMLSKPTAVLIGLALFAAARASASASASPSEPPRSLRLALGVAIGLGALIALASRFAHDTLLGGYEPVDGWRGFFVLSVLGRNAAHVLWPNDLLIYYAQPKGELDAYAWLGLLIAIGVAWLSARARGDAARLLPIAIAAALYLPISNLVPFSRVMSDSYLYGPLWMLAILCALALSSRERLRLPALAITCVVILALAASTRAQLPRYAGGAALWEPVVRAYPEAFVPRRHYAVEMMMRNDVPAAARQLEIAFHSEYRPEELVELGSLLVRADRIEDGECVLIEAVQHSADRREALISYALTLALFPHYGTHHPAAAKALLLEVDALRKQGVVPSEGPIGAALRARLAQLGAVEAEPPRWPRRTCRVLQR